MNLPSQWFFALCYNRMARFRLIPLSIWIPFSLSFILCLALRRFHSGCKCYSPTHMLPGTWSGFTPCYVLWQHPTYFQPLTPHPIPANLHTFSPWTLMGVISRFVSPYIKEEHINYPCFHCDPYQGGNLPQEQHYYNIGQLLAHTNQVHSSNVRVLISSYTPETPQHLLHFMVLCEWTEQFQFLRVTLLMELLHSNEPLHHLRYGSGHGIPLLHHIIQLWHLADKKKNQNTFNDFYRSCQMVKYNIFLKHQYT